MHARRAPAAPDRVAVAGADGGGGVRRDPDGGTRGARRRGRHDRPPDRATTRRSSSSRRSGSRSRGLAGLGADRPRPRHRSAKRYLLGLPIILEQGERGGAFPTMGGRVGRRPRPCRCTPASGRSARSGFRFAPGTPVQRGRPRPRLEPRRPLRAGAGARPPVRRRAPCARGARSAGDRRRAPGRDARPRRHAAHARVARRAGRSPTSASSTCSRTARSAALVAVHADPAAAGGGPRPRAVRARPEQRDAGRRRDPHRDHAARAAHAAICRSRPTAAPSTARPWSRSGCARCCRRRWWCAAGRSAR